MCGKKVGRKREDYTEKVNQDFTVVKFFLYFSVR